MKKLKILSLTLITIGCCAVLYYLPYREVRNKTINAFNNEQRILAKQAAKGIQSFFNHHAKALGYLTKHESIIDLDSTGKLLIEEYYHHYSDEISAITRIDATGKIIHTSPYNSQAIGKDVSYQEHNRQIIENHQPVVSEVFMAVQGYRTVALALPIIKEGTYKGCLTILIPFQFIAEKYLEDIQIGDSGYAWLLSRKGVELFCPVPGHTGSTIYETSARFPTVIHMAEKMIAGEQGATVYTYDQIKEDKTEPITKHAVYLPIELTNNFWSIVVATPESHVLAAMKTFRNSWFTLIVITLMGSTFFTIHLIRAKAIVREEKTRREAEAALRESEEKYRLLVENANDLIFIAQDQTMKFANPQTEKILGFTADELRNIPYIEHVHPDDRDKIMDRYQRQKRGEKLNDLFSFKVINKKGEAISLQVNARMTTWEGKPATINLARDVTALKQASKEKEALESQLRQALKMEAIGTLAGGIAHDFNNILAAILGYADMAKDDIPDWNPAKLQLAEVLKAGNRAKELVKQILAFSRKSDIGRKPVQIHSLVKEVLKLVRASIPTTIEIRQNIDSHCGTILADPTQIHQVVLNLCTNAAQEMDENGGVLEVSLDGLELTEKDLSNETGLQPGTYVRLEVKDTGFGIDTSIINRIFDPYFTTKDTGKGSGMGLAVAHGIVKNHDGIIAVESQLNQGTVFRVYLPCVEDKIHAEPLDTAPLPGGNEHILVVDDEGPMVKLTKMRLERLGYQVSTRTSSKQAYEFFSSQPDSFDLVLTDQTMPEMTGVELAEEIMGIRPDTPIVLCTGFSSKVDAETAKAIGIKAFAMKPVDNKKLAKVIRQVLDENGRQNKSATRN